MISPVKTSWPKELWLYERDGQEFGPTDMGGLQEMAASLHLTEDCPVWEQGGSERRKAGSLAEVQFPSLALPPALPPEQTQGVDVDYPGLYRSADQGLLLGLCAGLGHKFGIPPIAFRLLFVGLLPFGIGFSYLGAIALKRMPTRPMPPPIPQAPPPVPQVIQVEAPPPLLVNPPAPPSNAGTMTSVDRR
jgi:phage shock protein PspC (stress-responsive transcriptional regulator)